MSLRFPFSFPLVLDLDLSGGGVDNGIYKMGRVLFLLSH